MIRFSAVYTFLVTVPMLLAVAYDRMYGGGNHWFLFGTRLDQIFQYFGFATIAIVSTPLAVAFCWTYYTEGAREYIMAGVFLAVGIVGAGFFTLMVVD